MTARVLVAARVCECCGARFERRRFPSGQLERLSQFAERRFCSDACYRRAAAEGGKTRPVGEWIVTPYAQKARRAAPSDPDLGIRATPAKHASQNGAGPQQRDPGPSGADSLPQPQEPRPEDTP